jgi:hypothetical protein
VHDGQASWSSALTGVYAAAMWISSYGCEKRCPLLIDAR